MHKRSGFSLMELLVVIAIVALLVGILVPALTKVREQARSAVCRANLRTLAFANSLYANSCDGWFVPAVDLRAAAKKGPTWNSNLEFCRAVGVQRSKDMAVTTSSDETTVPTPREYLCPTDAPVGTIPSMGTYQDIVSYGYNVTDWGRDSRQHIAWAEEGPSTNALTRIKTGEIRRPAEKLMFIDSGDIWAQKQGADYLHFWDKYGHNLAKYRAAGQFMPTFYRHFDGANIAFFDGHVKYMKKQDTFGYLPGTDRPDYEKNNPLWYMKPDNFDEAKH